LTTSFRSPSQLLSNFPLCVRFRQPGAVLFQTLTIFCEFCPLPPLLFFSRLSFNPSFLRLVFGKKSFFSFFPFCPTIASHHSIVFLTRLSMPHFSFWMGNFRAAVFVPTVTILSHIPPPPKFFCVPPTSLAIGPSRSGVLFIPGCLTHPFLSSFSFYRFFSWVNAGWCSTDVALTPPSPQSTDTTLSIPTQANFFRKLVFRLPFPLPIRFLPGLR